MLNTFGRVNSLNPENFKFKCSTYIQRKVEGPHYCKKSLIDFDNFPIQSACPVLLVQREIHCSKYVDIIGQAKLTTSLC